MYYVTKGTVASTLRVSSLSNYLGAGYWQITEDQYNQINAGTLNPGDTNAGAGDGGGDQGGGSSSKPTVSGTRQEIADQGYQISGNKLYMNGEWVANWEDISVDPVDDNDGSPEPGSGSNETGREIVSYDKLVEMFKDDPVALHYIRTQKSTIERYARDATRYNLGENASGNYFVDGWADNIESQVGTPGSDRYNNYAANNDIDIGSTDGGDQGGQPGQTGAYIDDNGDLVIPLTNGGTQTISQNDPNFQQWLYWHGLDSSYEPGVDPEIQEDVMEIDPATVQWINQLYQRFWDRPATFEELQAAANMNFQALEQKLTYETRVEGYVSEAVGAEQQASLTEALGLIDAAIQAGDITPEIGELWKSVVRNYPPGVEFEIDEILETFNNIKDSTIDPYFRELIKVAQDDVIKAFDFLKEQRALEEEAERIREQQELRATKGQFEASGMTFSGQAERELGEEAATGEGGDVGELQERQQLLASSSQARYDQALYETGRAAESFLGTDMPTLEGYTPVGVDLTGEAQVNRDETEGMTLQQIINNYRARVNSQTQYYPQI